MLFEHSGEKTINPLRYKQPRACIIIAQPISAEQRRTAGTDGVKATTWTQAITWQGSYRRRRNSSIISGGEVPGHQQ